MDFEWDSNITEWKIKKSFYRTYDAVIKYFVAIMQACKY